MSFILLETKETIALLEDCVSERISEFYIKKRARRFHRRREKKEVKPKQEQPKMLQGDVKHCFVMATRKLIEWMMSAIRPPLAQTAIPYIP